MKLTVLGSSSKGNCYLIHDNASCLIIEAGIKLKEVKKALDFNMSAIVGCIASHVHADHSGYVGEYARAGIKVYGHHSIFKEKHHNFVPVEGGVKNVFNLGLFKIMAFELQHDVPCFGFLISHPSTGKFIFATDTVDVPYKFKELNHIMIEANYSEEIINENETPYFLRDRVIYNHLNIEQCATFLKGQDLRSVNNIILLHGSENNADLRAFCDRVGLDTMKNVYAAKKGLEINFNKNPF